MKMDFRFKKITAITICFLMMFSMLGLCACGTKPEAPENPPLQEQPSEDGLRMIYIPLDDRPINDYQVRLFAESLNIQLLMPDTGIYATSLNGAVNASGLQYGDRAEILRWLMDNESSCDVLVIYLDQLLSGGLMNSRCMDSMESVTLPDGRSFSEYDIIDYVASLAEKHSVYVIDSQLRIAASNGYLDFDLRDYSITRKYGMAARPELSEEQLTLENVIASYKKSSSGGDAIDEIDIEAADKAYFLGDGQNAPVDRILAIRERKLRLNEYAVEKLYNKDNIHYFFGVDDSSAGNNIQSSEYAYLKKISGGTLEKYSAIDCLAQLVMSEIFADSLGNERISVKLNYFGSLRDGELNFAGQTISGITEQIVDFCGGTLTETDPDVEVLIACYSEDPEESSKAKQDLIDRMNQNFADHLPTIYVDFSSRVNEWLPDQCDIGMLLSAGLHFNGSGCSAIMGISQGLARYRMLCSGKELSDDMQKAFLESLVFMFVKSYYHYSDSKQDMAAYLKEQGYNPDNMNSLSISQRQKVDKTLTAHIRDNSDSILKSVKNGSFIDSLNPYSERKIKYVDIESCTYPWNRTFEFVSEMNAKIE